MKISGIYKIINKVNGKYYVGSSENILSSKGRWAKHKRFLNKNTHPNKHLQSAWNKYTEESFNFIIVEKVNNPQLLLPTEQKYLDTAKKEQLKCYNKSFIAGRIEMTVEVRKKISDANKRRIWTENTRRLISVNNTKENHPLWGKQFTKKKCNIGPKNPMFDGTVYNFENGLEIFCGTRLDFIQTFDNKLSAQAAISAIISGKKNSHLGWKLRG